MFIKRNRTRLAGKVYESILLVQGKRVAAKRPVGRPRTGSPPPQSVVVHETLANLSRLPARLIEIIDAFCKGPQTNLSPGPAPSGGPAPTAGGGEEVEMGPCYGVLAGLHALARELGMVSAVGEATRTQRLALYLVYARLMEEVESRLAAARASEDHAVREALDVGSFDEDDLYEALEYLQEHQNRIEVALTPPPCGKGAGAVFLYDVTSVYFEGQHNALAEFGYNRDGKKGKKQMVAGLLCRTTNRIPH